MARRTFGGTAADFLTDSRGNVESGGVGTVWTARTGGTQITDLLDANGAPVTTVSALASPEGMVLFSGPDDGTSVVWVDFGGGRVKMVAEDGLADLDNTGKVPVTHIPDLSGTYAARPVGAPDDWDLLRADGTGNTFAWTTSSEVVARALGWTVVTQYGLVGDDSTDNAAAITAMVANTGIDEVTFYFPPGTFRTSQPWPSLDQSNNCRFRGAGGLSQGNYLVFSNFQPTSRLVYTGTTGTSFISAGSSRGFTVESMGIAHSSSSFTGDIINLGAIAPGNPTAFTVIRDATITSTSMEIRTARSALYVNGVVQLDIYSSTIGFAQYGILAFPDGTTAGTASYANSVQMYGGRLDGCSVASLGYPYKQWSLYGTVFEPDGATVARGVIGSSTHPVDGLFLFGCQFWDATGGGYWLDLYGNDVGLFGGFNDVAQPSTTVVRVNGTFDGLTIKGFYLGSGTLYEIASGATLTNGDIGAPKRPSSATRTAGDVSINSTSYVVIDSGLDITVAAQVGDVIELNVSAVWAGSSGTSEHYMEVATVIGSTPTEYTSGATAAGTGWSGWTVPHTNSDTTRSVPVSGHVYYTVQSADVDAGTVRFRLMAKGAAAGARTVKASATTPLKFWARNLGH